MEFSFDVSQTPLIGRRLLLKPDLETNVSTQAKISQPSNSNISGTPNSPRRSTSLSPADTVPLSGWKRPWMSQGRVRECLVNLLTTCGQRVGLPKSPSVSGKSIEINSNYLIYRAAGLFFSVVSFHVIIHHICIRFSFCMKHVFVRAKDEILSSLCSKVKYFGA